MTTTAAPPGRTDTARPAGRRQGTPAPKRLPASEGHRIRHGVEHLPVWMTVEEVCAELRIPRPTWDKWRQRGCGPRAKRLPNRQLRIHRDDLAEFMAAQPE